ncbi:PREDICTED: uncharacterized protein LOC18598288 isoform X2 [Theobroma cacao]|uniref:Uncharacterized protein LOC18598288 isoform X2 n=1 Tax=Theobroma cacao TaxID=3641 RepID=A0AB32WHM8_THECC|nr:PREDICTED: uncharacterized protein LOC18598288 isoform X2 [Theobroma cacao]
MDLILIRGSLSHSSSFPTSLMASASRQPLHATGAIPPVQHSFQRVISSLPLVFLEHKKQRLPFTKLSGHYGQRNLIVKLMGKASAGKDDIVPAADDEEDGISLGTMKLPSNTDLQRFETLLFQIDKIPGGARLGFITIGDGKTDVLVYIDCLVFPATDGSGPMFRAIRNGPLKDQSPPGEPRIMRSLLQALQKSVEIARV